jgi:hypothetical protein
MASIASAARIAREMPPAATIHHAMGIPCDAELGDPLNRPHKVCEGTPLVSLFS